MIPWINTNPNQRDSFSPEFTRQDDRVSNTYNVLDQIYGLDELSKAGEEKVNKVFDYGRGVKFANDPNPADPFRFTASTPTGPQLRFPLSDSTMGEAFGDFKRGLSGGTAPQTIPNLSIANQPRYNPGMIQQGGGIMSMLANKAVPGLGFLLNLIQSGGNSLQGGMQNLIDYRPTMNEPRDDGIKGGIDRLFNLGKGMIGAPNYKEDLGATNYGTNPMTLQDLINQQYANTNRSR